MFKEEDIMLVSFVGASMALFLSATLFIFFISYQRRKLRYFKEKQQLRTDFSQELLRAQLEIQEQTFQNISQEIHDNIGQMLSLAKLNLNTTDVKKPDLAEEKIQRSRDLVSKAISDLRDLSKSLNPDIIIKIGLSEAMQRELLLAAKTGQFDVNLSLNGELFRFDPHKELIVFRIFQEILNNIIKHSKAKTVNVKLDFYEKHFSLLVEDDGEGFDVERTEGDEGYLGLGLRNMRTRAMLIGAEFALTSQLQKGTSISIHLDL